MTCVHVCILKGLPPHTVTSLSVLSPEVGPLEAVSVETSLNWRDDQFLCVELRLLVVSSSVSMFFGMLKYVI